jgi:hypothetical protein
MPMKRHPPRLQPLLLLLALTVPGLAHAGYGAEGEPSFGISGYFQSAPALGQPTTLLVRVWGEDTYLGPVTSVARITVPDGITVLSGDTVSMAHVDRHSRKRAERVVQLTIRPDRYGSYVIRGWLGIDAGELHGSDETDFLLPLTIGPDSVSYARAPRVTRYENVRQGQRYRYGGRYLVPIDSTQALLEEEITSKPHAVRQEAAACHSCPGPLPTVVPFVVMVGTDGKVRESRFLDIQEGGSMDAALVSAANRVLQDWRFEPARAGSLAVADYVVVRVPVKDGAP